MKNPKKRILQWKVDKARHYFNCGWSCSRIAEKVKLDTYDVFSIVFDDDFHQETIIGHKKKAYYEDEEDYACMSAPAPLPSIRFVPGELTLKDLAEWQKSQQQGKLTNH